MLRGACSLLCHSAGQPPRAVGHAGHAVRLACFLPVGRRQPRLVQLLAAPALLRHGWAACAAAAGFVFCCDEESLRVARGPFSLLASLSKWHACRPAGGGGVRECLHPHLQGGAIAVQVRPWRPYWCSPECNRPTAAPTSALPHRPRGPLFCPPWVVHSPCLRLQLVGDCWWNACAACCRPPPLTHTHTHAHIHTGEFRKDGPTPLHPPCREFSLGAASLADSLGVALADACGILIQGCLFRANGLPGADFSCGS
jgi:hypothetical protein